MLSPGSRHIKNSSMAWHQHCKGTRRASLSCSFNSGYKLGCQHVGQEPNYAAKLHLSGAYRPSD